MSLDVSGDYTLFDGGETVTLRQIRPDGTTSVTVANALAGVVGNNRGSYQGVEVTGYEKSWSLNATQIGTRGVLVDDIITDSSGEAWRVLTTQLATLDTRWVVVTRRQL